MNPCQLLTHSTIFLLGQMKADPEGNNMGLLVGYK